MGKTNDELSNLVKQLSSPKVGGVSISKLFGSASLVSPAQNSTGPIAKTPSFGDTRKLSIGVKDTPTSIRFGSPSNSRTAISQSSSQLTNLLKQTASGGIASALTGGLGGVAGLAGLISGITSLFGGNKTLPALVNFQLPQSQEQTVYVTSNGSTTFQGTNVEQSSTSTAPRGINTGTSQVSNSGASSQTLQLQSAQVAQAVKNALLNSSSLNDVIAEI